MACPIQAWQSILVTLCTDSLMRSLNRSSAVSAFLLTPAFSQSNLGVANKVASTHICNL
jgi:hypothetical protein